jgi:hypothetical protein
MHTVASCFNEHLYLSLEYIILHCSSMIIKTR